MTEKEIIWQAFPPELNEHLTSLFSKFDPETKHPTHKGETVVWESVYFNIPSRIYWELPYSLNSSRFTPIEREIINCIFSRHHNGFIRQKAIRNIIHSGNYWTIPYVLRITGEYVIEIIEDIYSGFDQLNESHLISFIEQNPEFYNRIKCRIHSYWNCYYRNQFPEKTSNSKVPEEQRYVGFRLLNRIEQITKV